MTGLINGNELVTARTHYILPHKDVTILYWKRGYKGKKSGVQNDSCGPPPLQRHVTELIKVLLMPHTLFIKMEQSIDCVSAYHNSSICITATLLLQIASGESACTEEYTNHYLLLHSDFIQEIKLAHVTLHLFLNTRSEFCILGMFAIIKVGKNVFQHSLVQNK